MTRTSFADTLLERSHELAIIEELLSGLDAGRGGVLVLSGPPGIGKTSVLDASARSAVERGLLTLRARGDELVRDSSFATVRELLWGAVRAAGPDVWAGAARLAEPVFGVPDARDVAHDRAASVLHGLIGSWRVSPSVLPSSCVSTTRTSLMARRRGFWSIWRDGSIRCRCC